MSREWKPGDVARIGFNTAIRVSGECLPCLSFAENPFNCVTEGDHWHIGTKRLGNGYDDVASPLVVIDPESDEDVARLCQAYRSVDHAVGTMPMQAALREYANPKPPRIEEPGVWGVVEASCCHTDERTSWVHLLDGNWWPAWDYGKQSERTPLPDCWDDLIDPVLVRDGVDQ